MPASVHEGRRGAKEEGGREERVGICATRYVHVEGPSTSVSPHKVHTTSIDVRTAFVRLLGVRGDLYNRGFRTILCK